MTFTDLLLPPDLIAALSKQQISDPTPIQSAALPVLLAGKDAYLHAETGTGKTLAYLLPLFARIDAEQAATQVVIVAPDARAGHPDSSSVLRPCAECGARDPFGAADRRHADRSADREAESKPHVVVGSPGRIVELIERGKLKMPHVRAHRRR